MKTRSLIIVVLSAFAAPAMAATFVAQYVNPQTPSPAAPGGAQVPTTAPGLYVQVIDGAISLSNKGGSQQFVAGQFGYTASPMAVPVLLPKNPAVQFTPPPTFANSKTSTASTAAKSNSVDCEVR
jgi:hypothetical protein